MKVRPVPLFLDDSNQFPWITGHLVTFKILGKRVWFPGNSITAVQGHTENK